MNRIWISIVCGAVFAFGATNAGAQERSPQINVEVIGDNLDVDVTVRPRTAQSGVPRGYARDAAKGCLYHNPGRTLPDEYASWSGRCDARGYISGPGRLVYTYSSGAPASFHDYLEGAFRDGKLHGNGQIVRLGGQRESGTFFAGKLNGKGKKIFPNGSRYIGTFQNGVVAGRGRLIKADGSTYEGDFAANKAHGQGFYRSADGRCFEGLFSDNASVSGRRWACEY